MTKDTLSSNIFTAAIKRFDIQSFNSEYFQQREDVLAIEEPLEIQIAFGQTGQQQSLSITMRTPGQDKALAIGFLITEGIIQGNGEILICEQVEENQILVRLQPNIKVDMQRLNRHFYTTSSCGVCGKTSINMLQVSIPQQLPVAHPQLAASILRQLPESLRQMQEVFSSTGGLHAAGLFHPDGELALICEDVGRHNALDKLIGEAAQANLLPLHDYVLLVSGRASFELVQKALVAGIPILAAVGAPSSLAVDLAREHSMTLVGFLKKQRFNIYSAAERIVL